ncbi:MAG: signal recognition particle-docking protein FtsY [Chloroflexi bacterium]|nr:signal recognition particle-docking protein FtsY [Chloroflexota bacterium]
MNFFRRLKEKIVPSAPERAQENQEKTDQGVQRTRDTFFGQIARVFERPRIDDALWDDLEELLISADVGVETTEALIKRVKDRVAREHIEHADDGRRVLQEEMVAMLTLDAPADLAASGGGRADAYHADDEYLGPYVVLIVGVNGVGKTTSIAKLARWYLNQGDKVMLAAGDTFRAAAEDQIKVWGERVGVDVISHQPGADPGAVVFDAMKAARARLIDVLIIDTAGRLHTKTNLMEELKKVRRVIQKADETAPHEVVLVMDATTGQNGLAQAKVFTDAVGITGIMLAKIDGTAKGGIVLAVDALFR